jgi:multicomponent Na+:H+ antiporter subunit G
MDFDLLFDGIAAVLLLAGASLALAAAIGLLRFVDVLSRMHAATKPQSLGIVLCIAGAAIMLRETSAVWILVLTGAFQLTTAPVAAQLIGRLAYRADRMRHDRMYQDDLASGLAGSGPEKPSAL